MVAPTRTPQARGVKCDICKKILASATWLDQNNLAKSIDDARKVLRLIDKHNASGCLCIPRNIENLLVGSTHFEIHRLATRNQDKVIHSKQVQSFKEAKPTAKKDSINDCVDRRHLSRFQVSKIYPTESDSIHHLKIAVDFWRSAMEDQANPFNSKLALRLGLTHHVIYACYFFKFYKVLNYQLITANLLVNLFEAIEGVTANAKLHASFILVRSLLDCDFIQLAKSHIKQAIKQEVYKNKTFYESILLNCVTCELKLMDGDNTLDDLAELATIKPEDKLQHYFARTMALCTIIKYIHCYPARSAHCFEYFHVYRYICAIIRRCYESSFQLVLYEKDTGGKAAKHFEDNQNQIVAHSWIRPAVCDFVFSTFELLSKFYARAGMPEALELLYNGLELVSGRTGNHIWQAKLASVGSSLDLLCEKMTHSKMKLDLVQKIIEASQCQFTKDVIRLILNVATFEYNSSTCNGIEPFEEILQSITTCQLALNKQLSSIVMHDLMHQTNEKLCDHIVNDKRKLLFGHNFIQQSLKCHKLSVMLSLKSGNIPIAHQVASSLRNALTDSGLSLLDYDSNHDILEILVRFAQSDSTLDFLKSVKDSELFFEANDELGIIQSSLSTLTLHSTESSTLTNSAIESVLLKTHKKDKRTRLNIGKKSRGEYNVAEGGLDALEALAKLPTLTSEKLLVCYLRNSEPCPDYELYRTIHENLFSLRLKDCTNGVSKELDHAQLAYHFVESCSATTMRYRWMMFDEQQVRPYEPASENSIEVRQTPSKLLGFNASLLNSMAKKRIPDSYQIVQLKYMMDKANNDEHLIIGSFEKDGDPIFVHCERSPDFLGNLDVKDRELCPVALPNKFTQKVEEAKRTLLFKNSTIRTEARQKLESEIRLLLYDLENWIGLFKILFIGKILDDEYDRFVELTMKKIDGSVSRGESPTHINRRIFRILIENAPLLRREEFCRILGLLLGYDSSSEVIRDSFRLWTRSIETFVESKDTKLDKLTYFQGLPRSQVGLILDKNLEHIPFETMPTALTLRQGIFRVPSLRLFHIIASRHGSGLIRVHSHKTVYILDPLSNLAKTRKLFETKLRSRQSWDGVIGQPPESSKLEDWLGKRKVYLFIGHGAGTAYYNKLCKGRGLSAMAHIEATPLVMGCSSGRVSSEGPRLESFGINWVFIFRGSPAYTGLLWDVTDTDIDKFFETLLSKWMQEWNQSCDSKDSGDSKENVISITDAIAQSRQVCNYKFLVGATPVVYGLPVCCELQL